jgi:hypothetical protein
MNETNKSIQTVGFVGLFVVVASLWSAATRLPSSPVGIEGGLTPLLNVEMADSKASLEKIFGSAGSESRRIIAGRTGVLGTDFVPAWSVFLFFLNRLMLRIRPELNRFGQYFLLLLIGTLLLEYALVQRLAGAANAAVLTDGMMNTIYWLARLKWLLLFICTFHCSHLFYKSHTALRYGGELLWTTSVFGAASVFAISGLISVAVIGMFAALCGISVLFLLSPGLLDNEAARAGSRTVQSQD